MYKCWRIIYCIFLCNFWKAGEAYYKQVNAYRLISLVNINMMMDMYIRNPMTLVDIINTYLLVVALCNI